MLILDFENEILIDREYGSECSYMASDYRKEDVLSIIGCLPNIYRSEIVKCDVMGMDFDNEEIYLYRSVSWDEEAVYPEELLEEYDSYFIQGLRAYEECIRDMLFVESFSKNQVDAIADRIVDAFFENR